MEPFREARDSDRAAIERVLVAANDEFDSVGGAATKADIQALFARVGVVRIILAERDGQPVGCVAYFPPSCARAPDEELDALLPADHAYVGWLAVAPAHRRSGIGEALTRESITRARQDGASAVELFTAHYMVAAQRLYERLGFVPQPSPAGTPLTPYALAL